MSFWTAVRSGFTRYAEFGGRARRPEFWWWILFIALVGTALGALPGWGDGMRYGWMAGSTWAGSGLGPSGFGPMSDAASGGSSLAGVWAVVVLVPTLALIVRRLRDAGHAWQHLFWLLLPVAGQIVLVVLCAQPTRLDRSAAPVPESLRTS